MRGKLAEVGSPSCTHEKFVNLSLTDSRFAGGLTTIRNIVTVRNTDGISVDGNYFRLSLESSLSKSKTTHYIFFCVTALRLM